MSQLVDSIHRLFAAPSLDPQVWPLDLSLAWDQQAEYVALLPTVKAATQAFNDAQAQLNWVENVCDPHRSRWVTRDVSELERIKAHHERTQIKEEFNECQYTLAELSSAQQTLGAQIRKEMFRRRCASPARRELVHGVDRLLDPLVEANRNLFDYEQSTKILCGCEFAQDAQLYLREMLDPEQTGRPSQWRSFCKQEGM